MDNKEFNSRNFTDPFHDQRNFFFFAVKSYHKVKPTYFSIISFSFLISFQQT